MSTQSRPLKTDLKLWMLVFGILLGMLLPVFSLLIGVSKDIAFNPGFVFGALAAGIALGGVNYLAARHVITSHLTPLGEGIRRIELGLRQAKNHPNESPTEVQTWQLDPSEDEAIGQISNAFNELIRTVSRANQVNTNAHKFSSTITQQLDLTKLCASVVDFLLQYTEAQAAGLFVLKKGKLETIASVGLLDSTGLTTSEHVLQTLNSGKPTTLSFPENIHTDGVVLDFSPKKVLLLPIMHLDAPVAILVLAAANDFSDDTLQQTDLYAQGLSLALNNALSHEQIDKLASVDPLTGAYNRRYGLDRLNQEISHVQRHNQPLGLIMLDIDHFKKVNDNHGHLVGDQVITGVVEAVREALRESDIIVRYGGEEFIVMLPLSNMEHCQIISERIRQLCEEKVFKTDNGEVQITVSAGFGSAPELPASIPEDLIKLADEALYKAKNQGRNRVIAAS